MSLQQRQTMFLVYTLPAKKAAPVLWQSCSQQKQVHHDLPASAKTRASKARDNLALLARGPGADWTLFLWDADIHAKDQKKKNTPLHVACEKGFVDVIKLLAEAGSDLKAKNKAGESGYRRSQPCTRPLP